MASEYVRVGYLLPFRQIPAPVYLIAPFTRFDGVSVYETFDLGIGKLTAGVFGGTPALDVNSAQLPAGVSYSFADLLGSQLSLDGDGWRVRAEVSRNFTSQATAAPLPDTVEEGHTQTYSLGYRYDKNGIVSWGEYILSRAPDGTPVNGGKFVGVGRGYYVLGGYRIGKFMPRYTFAQGSQDFNVASATGGYRNGRVTSHTLGVNYEAGEQAVIKIEYEQDLVPSASAGGGYFVTQQPGGTSSSGGAFYAGVDFIF
jgi:hypothetical protein